MNYIKVNNKIIEIAGIFNRFGKWQSEDGKISFTEVGWKFLSLFLYVSFVTSLIAGGFLSDNRNESVYLIAVGIATSVAAVKLTYILWKPKEIYGFIHEVGCHSIENNEEFLKIDNKVKNLVKFSITFVFMVFVGNALLTFCLPIFSSETKLPFNIWFPLDWKNNVFNYCIAFAFVLFGIGGSIFSVLLNVIIWYLMMNCAIKYQMLGNQFKNMFEVESASKKIAMKSTSKKWKIAKREEQDFFFHNFIRLINTHQNIKRTIDRFKLCFANMFFIQIITSGICICGSVYVLAFVSKDTNDEILTQSVFYVVLILYNIFDIFMVTYLGNEIKVSSDRLTYCLFQSNWLAQSLLCKKNMIIFTEILQVQKEQLVVGKVYPLNTKTFTSIVNLAYSMFNVLKNVH